MNVCIYMYIFMSSWWTSNLFSALVISRQCQPCIWTCFTRKHLGQTACWWETFHQSTSRIENVFWNAYKITTIAILFKEFKLGCWAAGIRPLDCNHENILIVAVANRKTQCMKLQDILILLLFLKTLTRTVYRGRGWKRWFGIKMGQTFELNNQFHAVKLCWSPSLLISLYNA